MAARKLAYTLLVFTLAACSGSQPYQRTEASRPSPPASTSTAITSVATSSRASSGDPATSTQPPVLFPDATPTATVTPTAEATKEPKWSGEWEVSINAARTSILKVIQFDLPDERPGVVRAGWDEGTRSVYLEGILSADGRTITGTFWNSDVETLDFEISLLPSSEQFSGTAKDEQGSGSFCGARPGRPRPDPCSGG